MKRLLTIIFTVLFALPAFSQQMGRVRPFHIFVSEPGYITINEVNAGIGLGGTTDDFSKYFFGVTSLHGYQVNEYFMLGGATGFLVYEDGVLIPLYADMRLRFYSSTFSPYISASGGLLINPADVNLGTRMFINPSGGMRYTVNPRLALSGSVGLWLQMGSGVSRESFINTRVGVVYKFK